MFREIRRRLPHSISGKCHTLTEDEYHVLFTLYMYSQRYGFQCANLLWLARNYQITEKKDYSPDLKKENIEHIYDVLLSLWDKKMVSPCILPIKVRNDLTILKPKTKRGFLKLKSLWKITLAGCDCVDPPDTVADCIKKGIEKEFKETGKITVMKAFRECWKKYELGE